ncbi:hypothetical protein FOA43_003633 [Brettanomyces nanus]|uniref:Oligopeptide transporter n=1 Tax=Eeniella nana TaxID=13502 RepID=A0A875RWD6_EENNA|nr:uncharacterized protein FOA43_003633 [Brettanomyces nanus]QPG76247.1 hypothetical protein FOA43_003633 [Brettanomyces nanus]
MAPIELPEDIQWSSKASLPQVTLRSTIAGLCIGSVILISNFQFGLQTGWVSMMSLPAALLGFAVFKAFEEKLGFEFTDVENVFVQSVAVAVATGPLAYGFIGIIPAIEKLLTNAESGYIDGIDLKPLWKLVVWSAGVAFFGVFFAIPLRRQFVIREKLPFPSGSATATLISVFHGTSLKIDGTASVKELPQDEETSDDQPIGPYHSNMTIIESQDICELAHMQEYHSNLKLLGITSMVASLYTVVSYFIPQIRAIPIFGSQLSEEYMINFQPSPAYIGQGIIMGFQTTVYMLFGTILGWAILSPLAKFQNWAPGPTDDWKEGSEGWIMWISLSIMISDSVVSLTVLITKSLIRLFFQCLAHAPSDDISSEIAHQELAQLMENNNSANSGQIDINPDTVTYDSTSDGSSDTMDHIFTSGSKEASESTENDSSLDDVGESYMVPMQWVIIGLIGSCVLCIVSTRIVFGSVIPVYAIVSSVVMSLLLSILGVKALGETDLNPVSGIGKLSQLICAVIIPKGTRGSILINLISGAISEATTQQAGDLMQDLKTGYLLGASPKAQFIAQIYGSIFSIFMSSLMYKVYTNLYEIPGKMFKIPTAVIWIDCARLVNGTGLPPKVLEFSIIFGTIFGLISLLKNLVTNTKCKFYRYLKYLPDGVPVGIGIYNVPSFTFARFIGGLISYYWLKRIGNCEKYRSSKVQMIIFSSGLVLGEGLFSVVNMVFSSLKVPHL